MLNVPYLISKDESCRAHTGLSLAEFGYLLALFRPEYESLANGLYEARHGKKRERKVGGGKSGRLKTMEEKLFFVLYWLKTSQTYATLGGAFDLPRSNAYARLALLLPVLDSALKKTDWFLLPTLSDWQKSLRNVRKSGTSSSTPPSAQSDGVPLRKTNGATTPEKRGPTRKRTSP